MPELPEVETVRRTLEQTIINEKIIDVSIYYKEMIENVDSISFKNNLINQTIKSIKRYGKYLIFILDNYSLISHLRMEGKFFIKDKYEYKNMHEHIIFTFESGKTLRYHDTRKFGKMALLNTTNIDEIMSYSSLRKLGPEANTDNLTFDYLYNKLITRKEPIKTALLNQEILAGIGNIYADEICYLCKLHPEMPCVKLTIEDVNNIIKYSKYVLNGAIKAGGTTIRSYTSSLGVTGRFQLNLHVHTKENVPCAECKSLIKKIFVGGRGTYFCPTCQKERKPFIVGLTGGIATGKSTVSDYLINLGYNVIDSDLIVKKLYTSKIMIDKIKSVFGDEFIVNNKIDRNKLGHAIYNNEEMKFKLNSIVHPLVKQVIVDKIKFSNDSILFIDVPLLFEAGFESLCDKVIVVYLNEEENIKRLMKRDNIDEEYAIKKIKSQLSLEQKCRNADFIIDNSLDLCYTYKQIMNVIKILEE